MTTTSRRVPGFSGAVLAIVGGVCCSAADAEQVVTAATVQRQLQSAELQARARRLADLVDRRATDELVAELRTVAIESPELGSEWLIDRGLHSLARLPPTQQARSFVEAMKHRSQQILIAVDPDHGSHVVPLYDLAATARFTERQWERLAATEEASGQLANGSTRAVEQFAGSTLDSTRAGIADAYEKAATTRLMRQRDALTNALRAGQRVDELALVAARRLADGELFALVIGYAEPAVALRAVQSARVSLGDRGAVDPLVRAVDRQEIASAALLELGGIARHDTQARDALWSKVGDPLAGASAAAALASLHDASIAAELGNRLQKAKSETERRQLALALRLDDSPAARSELDRAIKAGVGSQTFRKEMSAWLRD